MGNNRDFALSHPYLLQKGQEFKYNVLQAKFVHAKGPFLIAGYAGNVPKYYCLIKRLKSHGPLPHREQGYE